MAIFLEAHLILKSTLFMKLMMRSLLTAIPTVINESPEFAISGHLLRLAQCRKSRSIRCLSKILLLKLLWLLWKLLLLIVWLDILWVRLLILLIKPASLIEFIETTTSIIAIATSAVVISPSPSVLIVKHLLVYFRIVKFFYSLDIWYMYNYDEIWLNY